MTGTVLTYAVAVQQLAPPSAEQHAHGVERKILRGDQRTIGRLDDSFAGNGCVAVLVADRAAEQNRAAVRRRREGAGGELSRGDGMGPVDPLQIATRSRPGAATGRSRID